MVATCNERFSISKNYHLDYSNYKAFSVENVFDLPHIRFENLLTKHSSTFDLSFSKLIFDNFFNLTVMGLDKFK